MVGRLASSSRSIDLPPDENSAISIALTPDVSKPTSK